MSNFQDNERSILHETYVFSEWKPEPEYVQKPDNILSENISVLWRWLKFFGPKKSLIDNITAYKQRKQKWHIALGDEGKVIAVLTDNILEIRTKRSEYATIAARTTVSRDGYCQWRKLVWSPDCSFLVLAYGNGIVSFFDLTASNLFNIPTDCSKPGGLECTDNTHAVAEIIFMPLRVKDNKWNWEVLIFTYDGKLRGFLISHTDGFKLHHTFSFVGGVGAVTYSPEHNLLYVAGVPRIYSKDKTSSLYAGLTGWRILNDDPFYKLSVVSDELEAQLANEHFHLYIPFVSGKNLAFIVNMVVSLDRNKLVCLHSNGDISIWRLPLMKLLSKWPLNNQSEHNLKNPLIEEDKIKDFMIYYPADVNWWSNDEIILSRFSGAVSVCNVEYMNNILGKKPEFLQGAPQVTGAHDGSFMALECESNILPARKSNSDDGMEIVPKENEAEDTYFEITKELFKSVLYTITDIEHFQPKPKKITIVSRIYRLLGIKSTTPNELFSRKIESGNYAEALNLASEFELDSDLVYQQQWRKTPVSSEAIQKFLGKVSKKIWAVHQCVDRLPETLPAAKELLQFGLKLTNNEIIKEINKDRMENFIKKPEDIKLQDLNAYTSELLRCRHVILFYRERLRLYEAILKCEKSTYAKDEYDRLRSNSIVHTSIEIAKEGRIDALTCLWPHIKSVSLQMTVLQNISETINPLEYKHLLPFSTEVDLEKWPPQLLEQENDWCKKEIFRSIWSSNWSEDSTPDNESLNMTCTYDDISKWYDKRAREIEERSGIVSHALTLVILANEHEITGLDAVLFHLLTLDTLMYDTNLEDVTLKAIEKKSTLETCKLLMSRTSPETFVSDLKQFVVPFLKRYEKFSNTSHSCLVGLTEYMENLSINDLSSILLVMQSPNEFELDVRTHLDLVEKCLYAYTGTDQLDKACDLLDTVLNESDGSISPNELLRRLKELEKLLNACNILSCHDIRATFFDLRNIYTDPKHSRMLLTKVARNMATRDEKPQQQDWEALLKDILDLQSLMFECVSKELCYAIYASSLLTSGDENTIKLAAEVLTCDIQTRRAAQPVPYARSVELVLASSKEYFNSASSLTDPALNLAKCCLTLIKDGNRDIDDELDLIASLQILNSFGVSILPIQVRLCEDRMQLIDKCLELDTNAYLASHKLLKLAQLLKISRDDEQKREGLVLQRVGECAILAGAAGSASAVDAARKLAALRHAPAADLLARVATHAAHADRPTRRELYSAAVAHCSADCIQDILRARLQLEQEDLQQELGEKTMIMRELNPLAQFHERYESTDDEYSDAITTPDIEKKDLIAPSVAEKKIPLFNYLLDTWQNKFSLSGGDKTVTSSDAVLDRNIHCQEFYHNLYPEFKVSSAYYCYDRFSLPGSVIEGQMNIGQTMLKSFYIQNCLENHSSAHLEGEVMQKCAEELMYKDTSLSVACLLRSLLNQKKFKKYITAQNTELSVSLALYTLLMNCNALVLKDNVFLTKPVEMARSTLTDKYTTKEHLELIRMCLDKLMTMVEYSKLKSLGYSVNGTLFNADEDYRKEIIYRMARSRNKQHVDLACSLAAKHGLDATSVWVQHATAVICGSGGAPIGEVLKELSSEVMLQAFKADKDTSVNCIREELWDSLSGNDHNSLIYYFTLLKNIDDKITFGSLTATEHIKLLKKTKAASQELNYKLLLSQPSTDELYAHLLQIMKPENLGILMKLLRNLPASLKIPVSVNTLYTMWLTKYFFSVSPSNATSKKWMQQYRQCVSYFNKLSRDDLKGFIENTCFSSEAVERVPPGTRNLMIMQAVDYCQQEQENETKYNKNDNTWSEMGQELTQWARFLESFHSPAVQNIIASSKNSKDEIWPEIEMSHGDIEAIRNPLGRLVMEAEIKSTVLATLLQHLHLNIETDDLFLHILDHYVDSLERMQTLVSRLSQQHKDNARLSEQLLERVLAAAARLGLPPHKQIVLLSLSQKNQIHDGDDLLKIVQFTIDLFKTEWADVEFVTQLTDDMLLKEEGRQEAFLKFLNVSDTWQRKKALVDVLNCWPVTKNASDDCSLQFHYIKWLLNDKNQSETLALLKLLLRKPVLTDQEIKSLIENAKPEATINVIWVILLSKCDKLKNEIPKLIQSHKEIFQGTTIEDELIKELLDKGLFLKLVSSVLYPHIVNYVTINSSLEQQAHNYNMKWMISELFKANFIAEAGQLQLTMLGVPHTLKGFSQSVLYCKNTFNKNKE